MRNLLLAILLCAGAASAQERFSNGFTQHPQAFFRGGFWWSQDNPGFGLDLHRAGDQIVGIWATYDASGDSTWYFGTASESGGQWVMPLSRYRWNGASASGEPAGQITLTFDGGYAATMDWQLGANQGSESIAPLLATDRPAALDQTGFWYDPAEPGYGYSVATQGSVQMAVMYFYDAGGQPRWAWADNIGGGNLTSEMPLLSFSGSCPGCPFEPPVAVTAGSLKLAFVAETLGGARAQVTLQDRAWDRFNAIALLSDRPSGRSAESQLMTVTNADLLKAWFDDANPHYPAVFETSVDFSPAAPNLSVTSTTNLQESGVDEADLIKTDGRFVYALKSQGSNTALRILALDETTGELALLTELTVLNGDQPAAGLYLVHLPAGPRLIVTSGAVSYFDQPLWFAPSPWINQDSRVEIYAVDDPANPALLADIQMDGVIIESRVIGSQLYTVSRDLPAQATQGASELPMLQINAATPQPLVDPSTILLPPQAPGYNFSDLITLAAFDLDQPTAMPQTVTYLGLAETLYASTDNIFVTSSRYGYGVAPLQTAADALLVPGQVTSQVHRFALTGAGIEYVASGEVAGFAGPGRVSPAFAFSQDGDHLRVVSQGIDGEWDAYRVSVLALEPVNNQLPVVGFAPNPTRPERLGKPGEMLYGLRFLGNRLYAVTFKQTDPLYIVDLTDPTDPFIAGALEVTGFSNYLHPLEGDLLLGVGKGAVAADGPGDGDFAWYQGLQISLFDVADPSTPQLLSRLDLGRRGSESSLLYEHHAFAMLPADAASGRPVRLAIPLVIHDAKNPGEISELPNHFYDYRYTGLGMFELEDTGAGMELVLRDTLISHTAESDPARDSWFDARPNSSRALITDHHAYLYLHGEFFSSPWGLGLPVAGPF